MKSPSGRVNCGRPAIQNIPVPTTEESRDVVRKFVGPRIVADLDYAPIEQWMKDRLDRVTGEKKKA